MIGLGEFYTDFWRKCDFLQILSYSANLVEFLFLENVVWHCTSAYKP